MYLVYKKAQNCSTAAVVKFISGNGSKREVDSFSFINVTLPIDIMAVDSEYIHLPFQLPDIKYNLQN